MRKSLLIVALFAASAFAQTHAEHQTTTTAPANPAVAEWAKQRLAASTRHREWVKVKSGNRDVNAFVVYPEVMGKATLVVVIHEIFVMRDRDQWLTDDVDDEENV